MSPRNPPPLPLQQVPGTPSQSHAIPPILQPPHPSVPHPPPSVTSPPPTPSAPPTRPTSLSANAGAFVPGKKISIKHPSSGQEVSFETLKRTPPAPAPVPPSPPSIKKDIRRQPIRIESQEQKEKRIAEERAKEGESQEKSRPSEALVRANEDAARREIEEHERREAEERKAKEEAESVEKERKEAEERAALEKERKEAEERAVRQEAERKEAEARAAREAREKEEQEKERLRLEDEARAQREALEIAEKERAEQGRLRKLQEEEEARAREEAERQRKAEEDAIEASADAQMLADDAEPASLPEEGEVEDDVSQPAVATEELSSANKGALALPSSPAPHVLVELPAKPSEKEPLRIDTSLPSPEHQRKRPGPLNLQATINTDVAPPLPSALATARHIEDINRITYPQGIKSPRLELNVNTQKGKFRYVLNLHVVVHLFLTKFHRRYDRDFLLQFMNICKEKPDHLPPLDVIGLEPTDTSHTMSRGGSGRNRATSGMSMPANARSASIGLGFIPGSIGKSAGSGFQMGQFSTSASKMSSEERFLASSGSRSASVSGGPLGSRPPAMVRTISQSGAGRDRTRSKRGANDSNRSSVVGNSGPMIPVSAMGHPLEAIAPLEVSANRWVAGSTRRSGPGPGVDGESPEMVERKVKGLLNKLTMERFDSISDQIIAWANKSEREKDGRTLIQVIKLVFEKATDEATFSEMYARLCRKMMEQISPKVQDDGIKNAEGKPFAGGHLFRKYLLNRCQEDFERGWVAKEATAAAAASKATEDKAVKEANENTKGGEEESELYSEEYYAAAKAKRRGLGLIRFIGELFKLQMLTERIMHECIKKLLGNVENPEEEEIESLCKLLTTVGSLLDTQKARAHLDVYFSRMRELTKNKNVNSRMMFMLQVSVTIPSCPWLTRLLSGCHRPPRT
jgi:translation initiation factor 4G